jgi:hypothetical protein
MQNRPTLILMSFALMAVSAAAQTNVTNSNNATTNTIPVYTGTHTLSSTSAIYQSSSNNVGIGTTAPNEKLELAQTNSNNALLRLTSVPSAAGTSYQSAMEFYTATTTGTSPLLSGRITSNFTGASYANTILQFQNATTGGALINTMTLNNGKVGIGTTSPGYALDVAGQVHVSTGVVYPDGTQQTTAWTGVVCGGDYAESVDVTGSRRSYEPGDLLVIDPDAPGKFLKSAEPYSTSVTGIFSTKPGTVGRRQKTPMSPDEVPMAMMGIVPTKVTAENGAIHPGDLLVTSSTLGYAMKGTDRSRMMGAVIGKALGKLDSGTGVIEVVVTLQ